MLLQTYDRIIKLFHEHHGYMNFEQLKFNKVTVKQIQELEGRSVIDNFSRGWYWCNDCGYEKPADYKYIEIAKVNPGAIVCMDSACFKHGILREEPTAVSVATERNDRKKMEFSYSVRRYYLQNLGNGDEVIQTNTDFGTYKIYSVERSICDCIRLKDKLEEQVYLEIMNNFYMTELRKARLLMYAKELRALKNIKDFIDKAETYG